MTHEFFEKLKEFVGYVEELQQRLNYARRHILGSIDKFSIDEIECMFLDHIFTDKEKEIIYNRNHVPMMSDTSIKISEFVLPPGQQILQTNQYQLVVSPLFKISKVVEYASSTDNSRLIQIIIEDIMKTQRFQEQKEPDIEEKERKKLEALAEKLLKKFLGSEE
jgi:hypothetical protein